MLEITARAFRDKQKDIFDKADKGENIIIRRGAKRYTITPISNEDLEFTPTLQNKIQNSIKQINAGESIKLKNTEEINTFLDGL